MEWLILAAIFLTMAGLLNLLCFLAQRRAQLDRQGLKNQFLNTNQLVEIRIPARNEKSGINNSEKWN